MYDNLCSLPVSSDTASLAVHPSEPLVTVGLVTGQVLTFRLPPSTTSENGSATGPGSPSISSADGKSTVQTLWKTHRHKGSCRCLAYSNDGAGEYSPALSTAPRILTVTF